MRTMTKVLAAVVLFSAACGGAAHSVDPVGSWVVTDTLKNGACAAGASETLTVVNGALQGYAMTSSWCGSDYCEMRGTKDSITRDVVFTATSADGNRTGSGCLYATSGTRQ